MAILKIRLVHRRGGEKDRDKRKSILVKGRNPMAKLFDGVGEDDDNDDDWGEEGCGIRTMSRCMSSDNAAWSDGLLDLDLGFERRFVA